MHVSFHFPTWAIKASNWIDDTLFPVPELKGNPDLRQYAAYKKVEAAANKIQRQIDACKTVEQSNALLNMVANMRKLYGDTVQVSGWVYSLHLAIYNRQMQIIDNL